MMYEHPHLHAGVRCRATPAARLNDDATRLRRRLPRLGLPRGRLPLRRAARAARRRLGGRAGEARRLLTSVDDATHVRRDAGAPRRSSTAATCWLSTWTTCRGCRGAAAVRAVRGARPPRRTRPARLRANIDALPRRARHRSARRHGSRCSPTPAVLGYVFNPLTLYWCHDPPARWSASSPRCTTPTASGTATCCAPTTRAAPTTDKHFYVSPFYPGRRLYRMSRARTGRASWRSPSRCTAPAQRPFVAIGARRRAGPPPAAHGRCAAALRHPLRPGSSAR